MNAEKISLCSQSLFPIPLEDAVPAAKNAGYSALELACFGPHRSAIIERNTAGKIVRKILDSGLKVSALSLTNDFTHPNTLEKQLEEARGFIGMAGVFQTRVIRVTPGPPGSAEASEGNWRCLEKALKRLVPLALEANVVLAFETHMRQLTDTVAGSNRLLELADEIETGDSVVGLTADFSNLAFAGDDPVGAIDAFAGRIFSTHIKNGRIGPGGEWIFNALDDGWTDYRKVLPYLKKSGYRGFLTMESMGKRVKENPAGAVAQDLGILKEYLDEIPAT